jgi:DNA-binding MltR family transcriptional regulator
MGRGGGKGKRSALPIIRDEVLEFRSSLTAETDRGVALVCAAYLETELEALLRRSFVNAPKVVEHLFEPSGSIGTLSSKIDLALATAKIDLETHRGLHLIRKIRNEFAHDHKARSFTDEDIAARCRELIGLNPYPEAGPRNLLIRASMSILAIVHARSKKTRHRPMKGGVIAFVESSRPMFLKVREATEKIVATLDVDQIKGLENPSTRLAAQKNIVAKILREVVNPKIADKLTRSAETGGWPSSPTGPIASKLKYDGGGPHLG